MIYTISKKSILIIFALLITTILAWCSKEEFFSKTESIWSQILSWKESIQKQIDCLSYKENLQKTVDEQAKIISSSWITYEQKINDIFFSLSQNVCFAIVKESKIYNWWKEEYYKIINLVTNETIKYDLKNKLIDWANWFYDKIKELKKE